MHKAEHELAVYAARQAGKWLDEHGTREVDAQDGRDIKLAADRKSEGILLEILGKSGIPVLSEESGMMGTGKSARLWIVDPLDGTANYWKGMAELSCVSVALWEAGTPVLGVVYRFRQDELFSGIVGEGAWLNGKAICPSAISKASDAVLATGFPLRRAYDAGSLSAFVSQVQAFKKIRMLGAAAIMGAFVANGRVDAYMEERIMLWDIAASSAIVQAAGGVADIEVLDGQQCICRLFANAGLAEDARKWG